MGYFVLRVKRSAKNCSADPGAPLSYSTDGGSEGFLGLKFWTKGFFWVYDRRGDFFGSRKKHRLGGGGIVLLINSNQQ